MAEFNNAKTAVTFASSSTINKALYLEKGLNFLVEEAIRRVVNSGKW